MLDMNARISLEQWRALCTVVEAGGYAQAAEAMYKTQSSVTYAVQKIERLLAVKLFQLQGRRAVLTEVGQVLYRRGRQLLMQAEALEQAAGKLALGWEPELRLAVDALFPTWLLLECMGRFSAQHPDTRIELFETVLGGTEETLLEGRAELAICSRVPAGFMGELLLRMRLVAAAHPQHPLHQLGREITQDDLAQHRHVVIRDSGSQRNRNPAWLGERRWTVSHKATRIHAVCLGLGFAWFAEDTIRNELHSGQLKRLPLAPGFEHYADLYLVLADASVAGPGMRCLAEMIRSAAATCTAALAPIKTPGQSRAP